MRNWFLVGLLAVAGCGSAVTMETGQATPQKVWVCKYVGTPGVDERLQTGQNPISVSVNAIPLDPVTIFSEFADAQGRSLVIAFDDGGSEPPPTCPPPVGPPPPPESTTTTTISETTTSLSPTTSTTTTTTTTPPTTSTSTTTTTVPEEEDIFVGAVGTTCQRDTPVITIRFGNQSELNGRVGTLTFIDLSGNIIEIRPITYQAGGTVIELYPGASVDPITGEATDWPGWVQNADGLWVEDPTDAAWRAGLVLVVEINPTASTLISYPPASSACANPENPLNPGTPVGPPDELPPAR